MFYKEPDDISTTYRDADLQCTLDVLSKEVNFKKEDINLSFELVNGDKWHTMLQRHQDIPTIFEGRLLFNNYQLWEMTEGYTSREKKTCSVPLSMIARVVVNYLEAESSPYLIFDTITEVSDE